MYGKVWDTYWTRGFNDYLKKRIKKINHISDRICLEQISPSKLKTLISTKLESPLRGVTKKNLEDINNIRIELEHIEKEIINIKYNLNPIQEKIKSIEKTKIAKNRDEVYDKINLIKNDPVVNKLYQDYNNKVSIQITLYEKLFKLMNVSIEFCKEAYGKGSTVYGIVDDEENKETIIKQYDNLTKDQKIEIINKFKKLSNQEGGNRNNIDYYHKYMKYKSKYLALVNKNNFRKY